jgi:imidazolonepropionase-like amidohydrolase
LYLLQIAGEIIIMRDTFDKYALTGGVILDGTGCSPYEGSLIVCDDKIAAINGSIDGCEVINIPGCTALPGFINAHTHPGYKYIGETEVPDYELGYLEKCLAQGVTTVRDMGALNANTIEEILSRRDKLNASGRYPFIVSAGKFIAAPGGYGGIAPLTVSTKEEAREIVDRSVAAGADFIKTSLENGFSPETALPKLSVELLNAICSAARSRGFRVAAHLSQCEPLRALVQAGITDAGHVPYEPMDDELIALMVTKAVCITPTLTLYRMLSEKYGAPFLQTALDNVRRFAAAEGTIAVGDDYIEPAEPWYPQGLPWGELELLHQAGLSNRQIIQALTANGAEVCGLGAHTGTLQAGKLADITVVRGDPLTDLSCLKNIRLVSVRGRLVVNQ